MEQQRLLIVLRCMKNCGFDHVGAFLVTLFTPAKHGDASPAVTQIVSAFLQKRTHPGSQPIDVLELMYSHPKAEAYDTRGQPIPVSFPSLPRHSRPRQERPLKTLPIVSSNSTRGDVLDWTLAHVILPRVDFERDQLLAYENGLSIHNSSIKWKSILEWDASKLQDIAALQAPTVFACISTLCINKDSRKKLESAVAQSQPQSSSEVVGCDRDSTTMLPTPGVEPTVTADAEELQLRIRRDPWLVTTTQIMSALNVSYQYATSFLTFVGCILFVSNAPGRIYRILGRLGLSVSHSTTLKRLNVLAEDASNRVCSWGQEVKDGPPYVFVLWDNVNKRKKPSQITLATQDHMNNGTASTVIRLEDIPLGALDLLRRVS
ncbi:hypothetical protein C8Q80DRAFT_907004 [Daedaleopsis nitida]|nr:hypothetical protein C8Q80DRAFT_907004 [Daedaleopsis nitida]